MEFEYFTSIMTPGVALLILSTTMRLGNVRLALTELAKIKSESLEQLESYQLFAKRAVCLCIGLRLLNTCLLLLIPSALGMLFVKNFGHVAAVITIVFDVAFFLVLFSAVLYLFKESQITGRSIMAHTMEIRNSYHVNQ